MAHPLALLAGELLIKAAGKKIAEKRGKEAQVKEAAKEVISAVHEDGATTMASVPFALAAAFVSTTDIDPALAETITPLIQQLIAGISGLIALGLATWKKRK